MLPDRRSPGHELCFSLPRCAPGFPALARLGHRWRRARAGSPSRTLRYPAAGRSQARGTPALVPRRHRRHLHVEPRWSGTLSTSAKEVTIDGLEVGRTKVAKLTLPAIDLSAIGKACGGKIDGILGADLLEKIGATVDLRRQILHVSTTDEERDVRLASEIRSVQARSADPIEASDGKS